MTNTDRRSPGFLEGGGELGELMRSHDWTTTPLGPPESWPRSLETAVRILLTSRQPFWLGWGPELTYIYNDPYRSIIGGKHPRALGRPFKEVWSEIWDVVGPMADLVMTRDEGTYVEAQLLIMERHGYPEETYYTFSYSPIPGDDGRPAGLICANTDDTSRVIGERQIATLRDVAARAAEARNWREACARTVEAVEANRRDVPFILVYAVDAPGGPFSVAARSNDAGDLEDPTSWPLEEVVESNDRRVVAVDPALETIPTGAWSTPPTHAAVLPLASTGRDGHPGALVVGLNPFRKLDDSYRDFLDLLAKQVSSAIAHADAYEQERKRAESLAQLDRAKTEFFSNVSHEFRTPLTLMLGPLEDVLSESTSLSAEDAHRLTVAHRNASRLLKLVNTLLDFSRIEAGRIEASYEPTDLAAFTTELASLFRSAIEHAGLALLVDCPPLDHPVHVDREMWEKIVFNLLSNAFKFTFEGEIRVVVRAHERGGVVLAVTDTGTGIPAHEVPHLFERFRRVEGARGRTIEGTGIGLALVQELVKLHGGSVEVETELGRGTRISVVIPDGTAHLPPDRLRPGRKLATSGLGSDAYVQELLGWNAPQARPASPPPVTLSAVEPSLAEPSPGAARVLIADDNADMRDYMRRLLAGRYHVETTGDGATALSAAHAHKPDIVVTDVMMPELDGFGLLRELRADERLRSVPVIMLSARAGEEARIEGMQAGADDYLVKPFGAREFLARVQMHIELSRLRSEGERRWREFADAAPAILWITDRDNQCMFLSRGWYEFTGQQEGDGLGIGWTRAVHPDDRERAGKHFADAAVERRSFSVDYRLRRGDGAYRWAIDTGRPRFDDQGRWLGYIGSVIDVHERKQTELALIEADARKDEFLAMLGHELRNPLSAIRSAIDLLELTQSDGSPMSRAHAVIARQTAHMTRLVDGLLEVSRISRGKIALERRTIDLVAILRQVMADHAERASRLGLTCVTRLPSRPLWVWGDPVRLVQVFDNLLGNAIKFTVAPGTIDVVARADGETAVVRVRDSGVGIQEDMLGRIFEPFQQVVQDIARSAGGLGLGLALCKGIVALHGGTIAAKSAGRGMGSELCVVLPLASAPSQTTDTRLPTTPDGIRILVVEDNADASEMLQALLETRGHVVSAVETGGQALELLQSERFQLVLCDLGLPGMSGYDIARAIRADARIRDVHLVALTGYGQPEDRRRTEEAGFDAHLVKPVDLLALDALLTRIG